MCKLSHVFQTKSGIHYTFKINQNQCEKQVSKGWWQTEVFDSQRADPSDWPHARAKCQSTRRQPAWTNHCSFIFSRTKTSVRHHPILDLRTHLVWLFNLCAVVKITHYTVFATFKFSKLLSGIIFALPTSTKSNECCFFELGLIFSLVAPTTRYCHFNGPLPYAAQKKRIFKTFYHVQKRQYL